MSSIRVRFAPSPTGTLHVGGARTALFNWLYARMQKGVFILRIEDTDLERSTAESHEQILRAMRWMGLDWDEGPEVGGDHGPYVQSERLSVHQEYLGRLVDEGHGYSCYCTSDEVAARRKAAGESESAGYDGFCRDLSADRKAAFEAEGRKPVLRVRTPDEGSVRWTDIVHGETEFPCDTLTDWVAVKADGSPTYNFAAVVDDGLMEISHVLRGDDHVSNTPRQILLFKAFGFRVPKFGHMPMILGADKQRLSKRHGAASVEEFRDQGFLPEALVNYLALLGWSPGTGQEVFTRAELVKKFSLKRLNNTAAVFDIEKCKFINAEHMKSHSVEERADFAWPFLARAGLTPEDPGDDPALRARVVDVVRIMGNRFGFAADAPENFAPYLSDTYPVDPQGASTLDGVARERMVELAAAFEALATFDASSAETALRELAEKLGVKAGELIHPARFAVTGQTAGPSVFDAIAVVGQERAVRRLRAPRPG
jgi:glutamyl-tRNA synthetase